MSSNPVSCPLCKQPVDPLYRPFCSRGCRDRDLLNWMDEGYRVPVQPHEESDDSGLDSTPNPSL